ncbi:hypothetical protein MPER_02786, partial [Moniliophthora perniciosa FA553]
LVLNPQGRHYSSLKAHLDATHEPDAYFDQDAIFLERNSRDFARRCKIIDANADAICTFLYNHKSDSPNSPIKEVFYPKYITPEHYSRCRLPGGGDGGLFSVTFTSKKASEAFFDALPVYKGPSLGNEFHVGVPRLPFLHITRNLDWPKEVWRPRKA